MKKLSYLLMVGLAFTVLQVTTVEADQEAGMAPGTHDPADCGGVPCPTGDHPPGEHHDGPPPGEDCANKPTPEETAACWDQQGGHMDHPGDHPPTDMPPMGSHGGQPPASGAKLGSHPGSPIPGGGPSWCSPSG